MLMLAFAAALLQPVDSPALEVRRDPITDRVSAFAIVRSPEGRLAIGCDPEQFRGVRVLVHSSRAWFARERFVSRARSFTFRFDRARPTSSRWATERRTAWPMSSRVTRGFIQRARTAHQVVVRTTDMEGRRFDLSFDLTGARPLINEALGLCTGAFVPSALPRR